MMCRNKLINKFKIYLLIIRITLYFTYYRLHFFNYNLLMNPKYSALFPSLFSAYIYIYIYIYICIDRYENNNNIYWK